MRDLFYLYSFKFKDKLFPMYKVNTILQVVFLSFILSSCSTSVVDRTKYIPKNSILVGKFNAAGYVKDTFDDYLTSGQRIYPEVGGGVLGMLATPDKIGVESFTDHYFYLQSIPDGKRGVGIVLSLSSERKMSNFLSSEGIAAVAIAEGKYAVLNDSTEVVWTSKTAIIQIWPKTYKLDKKKAERLLDGSGWGLAMESKQLREIQDLKSSEAHLTLWTSKYFDYAILKDQLQFQSFSFLLDFFLPDNSSSLLECQLNGEKFKIDQKIYLNDTIKSAHKKNTLSHEMLFIPETGNQMWFSASFSQEKMLDELQSNDVAKSVFEDHLSALLSMEELTDYLSGDMFLAYNGNDTRKKMIFESSFNQKTGEYESGEVSKEVTQSFYSLALGLVDGQKMAKRLEPMSSFLNVDKGVYNFKEEYFFQVKNNVLYFGTSMKSKGLFKGEKGLLTKSQQSMMKNNLAFAVIEIASSENLKNNIGINGLSAVNIKKKGSNDGVSANEFSFLFEHEHNAVIEISEAVIGLMSKR